MTTSSEQRFVTDRNGPLHGLRVLDLTAMLAGPYATMLLTDLGADVIKIEPPWGDSTRRRGPFREGDGPKALGGYFQSVNRGKRSLALDLKGEGKETFLQLVRVADVVIENFTAGVMENLGLGYEQLAAENPRLVYGAVRGFGDPRSGESPYVDWPAVDVVAQAVGGLLGITGLSDGTPIKCGPGVGDIFPGTLMALGVLAAVHHAQRTGQGQFVDVAMYDAILSLCERTVYQHSYLGAVPTPQGNSHPFLCPFDIFQTADGWIALAAPHDHHWAILAGVVGRPDMAEDERYRTSVERGRNGAEVRRVLGEWLAQRSTKEVVDLLGGRVPLGPVNNVASIYADPHVAARDMLAEVPQPDSDRPVTLAGSPIKLSLTPAEARGRGPHLDEDDAATILDEWTR